MESSQTGGHPDFEKRAFNLDDVSEINSQKVFTIFKRRRAVRRALDMIEVRMQDPPTLHELASSSGLSRTYFSHVFRDVTGMRLQDYLIQARLNKAKTLLNNIDLKIKEIAYETGFQDPNYFCRAFKRKTGQNPTSWRLRKILARENLHRGDRVSIASLETVS